MIYTFCKASTAAEHFVFALRGVKTSCRTVELSVSNMLHIIGLTIWSFFNPFDSSHSLPLISSVCVCVCARTWEEEEEREIKTMMTL